MQADADRGELLARFLNASAQPTELRARVTDVFALAQQLDALDPLSAAAGNLRYFINAHLSEIRVRPVLRQNTWEWIAPHPGAAIGPNDVSPEYALSLIAALSERGALERMRRCEACQQWFFALTAKKRVCSDACRSKKFKNADPDAYRTARAAYMRNYRPLKKRAQKRKRM